MIREWKPTKRQEDFLSLPDSVFEALYGGAAGGGKSDALFMLPLVREFYKCRDFKGLLLRRTYPELEKELILRSKDFYPLTGAVYNESKKLWSWPAFGSYVQFGYAEHEQDVRRYDTSEYNYVGFDELTSFTEFQYKYIAFSRCRSKADSGLPAIVRSGTNPGNIGHGWVRVRFIEPCPAGNVILSEKLQGDKVIFRIFIPSKVTDNPHVDRGYVDRLQMLPEAEKKAKLDGDWWTFTGQVFDDWRIQPFADEPANARHVIIPFAIPDWWPVVLAVDWGYAAMMWSGFAAIGPDRRVYLCEEYTKKKTNISTWATELGVRARKYPNLVDVVVDPSMWQKRGEEHALSEQFQEYSGLSPRKADQDRIGGKVLMQEFLRWKPRPTRKVMAAGEFNMEYAEWLRRNKGTAQYNAYVDQFVPETPEGNIPILQVFDTCVEFIRVIPLCVYNDPTKPGVNMEDVAEFNGDDPYDGGRYLIKSAKNYLDSAVHEGDVRDEIARVCKKAEETGNLTHFYRQMDRLEHRQKREHRTVIQRRRRYGRNRH